MIVTCVIVHFQPEFDILSTMKKGSEFCELWYTTETRNKKIYLKVFCAYGP